MRTMKITNTQRLILYALGHFYQSINQPLVDKPVTLQTSKITFIEHLLNSGLLSKHERALYKNLETLENAGLIEYDNRMIKLTEEGLKLLAHINSEISQCMAMHDYFEQAALPKRRLQTVISERFI